jgi:hypothetical protein
VGGLPAMLPALDADPALRLRVAQSYIFDLTPKQPAVTMIRRGTGLPPTREASEDRRQFLPASYLLVNLSFVNNFNTLVPAPYALCRYVAKE